MKDISVRPVKTRRERRLFLTFPWCIYKSDPLWVPPLLPDRRAVIDPERGAFFKHGVAEFFIAWRDGQPVGTICAAEDKATNKLNNRRECMFGFFECIDDEKVAHTLFDQVVTWANAHHLTSLRGPFNLDYENGYGILLEGRDRPPALLCGHTPEYYQKFVENYGFTPARSDNVALYVDISEQTPALRHLSQLAERVSRRRDIVIREPDLSEWDSEIDRIHHLLNTALVHLEDHIKVDRDVVEALVEPFKEIADMELVLFAEVEGKTVGWLPGIDNLNEVFMHVNGLRYPWDYLKLWRYVQLPSMRLRHRTESLTLKSVLIHPEYWNTGVAVLLFAEMAKRAREKGYQWVDCSITSMDNPQTILIGEHMGAKIYKRWRVYRKQLEVQR